MRCFAAAVGGSRISTSCLPWIFQYFALSLLFQRRSLRHTSASAPLPNKVLERAVLLISPLGSPLLKTLEARTGDEDALAGGRCSASQGTRRRIHFVLASACGSEYGTGPACACGTRRTLQGGKGQHPVDCDSTVGRQRKAVESVE